MKIKEFLGQGKKEKTKVIEPEDEPEPEEDEYKDDDEEEPEEVKQPIKKLEVKEEKPTAKIVSGEFLSDGMFRFVLITNKSLGEIGVEFEI